MSESFEEKVSDLVADLTRQRDAAWLQTENQKTRIGELLTALEKLHRERDEARSMTERQWLLRVGSRLCMAGCKSDGILDSIDEIIRERDETRGAIKSTIAWLQSRRNAPDFTTMGMVEERLLKALGAAK